MTTIKGHIETIWDSFQDDLNNCDDSCRHLSIKSESLTSEHFGQMRTDIITSRECCCEDGGLTCPRTREIVSGMLDLMTPDASKRKAELEANDP